jgi:hypothetical protein
VVAVIRVRLLPSIFLGAAALLLGAGAAHAQMAADTSLTAPPVAPPLKTNSPLYHLTYDPKVDEPQVGYREGDTSGAVFFIAHRAIDTDGGQGFGWLRKSTDDRDDGTWFALQEQPGLVVAPFRKLKRRDGDSDWEYKFWGHYATYKAYDPHLDELLPVFVLQGYEVIGQAAPLKLRIGPPGRPHSRPSGASSRSSNPIQGGDID